MDGDVNRIRLERIARLEQILETLKTRIESMMTVEEFFAHRAKIRKIKNLIYVTRHRAGVSQPGISPKERERQKRIVKIAANIEDRKAELNDMQDQYQQQKKIVSSIGSDNESYRDVMKRITESS